MTIYFNPINMLDEIKRTISNERNIRYISDIRCDDQKPRPRKDDDDDDDNNAPGRKKEA